MDELNKIPPVSRFIILGTLGLTVPVILKLISPSPFVFYLPLIRSHFQFWRPFTSFFLAGSGIQLIFDLIALFRSSTALEEGEPFYRSSSTYAWTLILTNALIVLLNIPLGSALHFRPMLYAITTFWSRAYQSDSVNMFGIVNVRAPLLPYTYLILDVLMAGPHMAIQSGTGILAAYAIHYIRDELPRPPPGNRLTSQGSILKRAVGAVQKFVCEPPQMLQRFLPDSNDPVSGASGRPTSAAGATTGEGRAVRSTPFGTAFAPRGRAFGSAPTAPPSSGGSTSRQPSTSSASTPSSAGTGWLGGLFSSGSASSAPGPRRSNDPEVARREAMLDAIERRAREARNDSIAGRAQQAASGSNILQGKTSHTSALASSSSSTLPDSAVRRTAASTSTSSSGAAASGQGAHGNVHSLRFGSAVGDKKKDDGEEPELDASGSGGRVAEQRRSKGEGKEGEEGKSGAAGSSSTPSWGGGGGRRLDD
ncbi:hypothetical protein A4X13_0g2846 [Tilletia indica]|uniref:Derlin n=1 Tax=Tilletia indica TaxID=43049 RepID=A0A177TGY3_9BASI|nr:hypothetical protein A4X13_0g2846 [Tilletia indica]